MSRHSIRLSARTPFDGAWAVSFLRRRVVAGIEEPITGGYRRSLALPHAPGVVDLVPRDGHVDATFVLEDDRDLDAAAAACRRLLDLDRDPAPIAAHLDADPVIGELVRAVPGRRVPGHSDGCELAVRAVLGQQVTVAAGTKLVARVVDELGTPLPHPVGRVTHLFPVAAAIARLEPDALPMPRSRGRTLVGMADELAAGRLVLNDSVDRVEAYAALLALPGIGLSTTPTPSSPATWAYATDWCAWDLIRPPARPSGCPSRGGRTAPTPSSTCGRWHDHVLHAHAQPRRRPAALRG
jgi:AraC family transcriptional regulator of adaptative response / DNA-3-methyladenine glycosylase II